MMELTKVGLIVLLMTIVIDCHAQFSLNPPRGATTGSVQYIHNIDELNAPVEYPIKGTPYLQEAFSKGNIYSRTGSHYNIEMRYNIFSDGIEFRRNDSIFIIDPDLKIKKIVIDDQTFVVEKYKHKGKVTTAYFMRLDSGKVNLMSKPVVVFKDRQQKPIEGEIPAQYQRMPDEYYFEIGTKPLIKIRSIKKVIEALPDHKKEMEQFAKKEKISAKKAEKLTSFFRHYNSLPRD